VTLYTENGMGTRERNDVEEAVERTCDELGRELRSARAGRRLTQQEVARIAGTSPVRVSAIETGKDAVRVDTLARIAKAVGLRLTLVHDAAA
jgi:DNA-binding XRE family transcriptional regulator